MCEEENEMIVNPNKKPEKKVNPFVEAKKLVQKAMKENGKTPEDVTRALEWRRSND